MQRINTQFPSVILINSVFSNLQAYIRKWHPFYRVNSYLCTQEKESFTTLQESPRMLQQLNGKNKRFITKTYFPLLAIYINVYKHKHKCNINTLSRYGSVPLYTPSFQYFENTYDTVRAFPVMCVWFARGCRSY